MIRAIRVKIRVVLCRASKTPVPLLQYIPAWCPTRSRITSRFFLALLDAGHNDRVVRGGSNPRPGYCPRLEILGDRLNPYCRVVIIMTTSCAPSVSK